MTKKQELLYYMYNPTDVPWKNIIRCSENWYNPFYAMAHTFSIQEISRMSEETVEACIRVADAVGEGLY